MAKLWMDKGFPGKAIFSITVIPEPGEKTNGDIKAKGEKIAQALETKGVEIFRKKYWEGTSYEFVVRCHQGERRWVERLVKELAKEMNIKF